MKWLHNEHAMIMALWLPLTMVGTLYVSGVVAQMTYEVGRVLTDEFDNSDGSKWAYVAADMYMRVLMHVWIHTAVLNAKLAIIFSNSVFCCPAQFISNLFSTKCVCLGCYELHVYPYVYM